MTTVYMAYLLKNDSVHGPFKGEILVDGTNLIVNGRMIRTFAFKDPSMIPWGICGAEFVAETSGAFTTTAEANGHLRGGAKKVVISGKQSHNMKPYYLPILTLSRTIHVLHSSCKR